MKQIIPIILVLATLSVPSAAQTSDSSKYELLDPYYFHLQYLREDPALLIDVRQPFEYRRKRLKESLNIPSGKSQNMTADTLSSIYSLFLYCTTDFRSINAAEFFYRKGFRKIFVLEGGITFWKKEGMPVEKGRVRKKRE